MLGGIILKKRKIVIIVSILIFIVVSLIIIFINRDNLFSVSNPDGKLIAREYKKLNGLRDIENYKYPVVLMPSNNILKYIDIDGVMDIFENQKDAVIYMGYAECLYCRHVIEILCDSSSFTELEVIYYLDTSKLDDKDNDKLYKLLGEDFIIEYDYKILDVPFVLFVANGSIVSYHKGTLPEHNPYVNLTDEQRNILIDIYRLGYRDVLESIK